MVTWKNLNTTVKVIANNEIKSRRKGHKLHLGEQIYY